MSLLAQSLPLQSPQKVSFSSRKQFCCCHWNVVMVLVNIFILFCYIILNGSHRLAEAKPTWLALVDPTSFHLWVACWTLKWQGGPIKMQSLLCVYFRYVSLIFHYFTSGMLSVWSYGLTALCKWLYYYCKIYFYTVS